MAFKRMITAVDTHSGIPMRVITGGVGHIPGASVMEKMRQDRYRGYILLMSRKHPVEPFPA